LASRSGSGSVGRNSGAHNVILHNKWAQAEATGMVLQPIRPRQPKAERRA
jgi:hypothetical protein